MRHHLCRKCQVLYDEETLRLLQERSARLDRQFEEDTTPTGFWGWLARLRARRPGVHP